MSTASSAFADARRPRTMAARIAGHDWATTPLGPRSTWPTALAWAVDMLLEAPHPMAVCWGPELTCLYNDAFATLVDPSGCHDLGLTPAEAFAAVCPALAADIDTVGEGGPPLTREVPTPSGASAAPGGVAAFHYACSPLRDGLERSGVLITAHQASSRIRAPIHATDDFERLTQLFDRAPILLAILAGPTHLIRYANPAYRALLANRTLVGQTVAQAIPELIEQGELVRLDEVLASGAAQVRRAASFLLPAGPHGEWQRRRLDYVLQPTVDPQGERFGVLFVGADVTEHIEASETLQRQAEQLQWQTEQLRLATEHGEVGLWDVDPVADTLYWPARVRRMFGIHDDRAVTMHAHFYLGVHPADRDRVVAAYEAAMDPSRRAVYDVEYRTVGHDDGIVRWVAARGRGVFDDTGRCVRMIGTARDVSEKKRDEQRLRELNLTLERRLDDYLAERKLLVDVVEGTNALIQVIDTRYRLLAGNRVDALAFEQLYGVRPRVGDDVVSLLSHRPEAQRQLREIWQRALVADAFVERLRIVDREQRERWYEMHFQPLFDREGRRIGAYRFGYDVTEAQASRERLAATEAALDQARRMEAIGLLTGGVAHDFNNVLQAVSTTFELLRRKADDPSRVRSLAGHGLDATRKAARVTAQLLAFSRHQVQGERRVDLAALLDNLSDLFRTTLGPTISLSVQRAPCWVHADAAQLEMALLNLVVNARDAMPQGGQLWIDAHPLPDAARVRISVRDEGPGMAATVRAQAFTPFYTTKGFGKGSGLGLAQVWAMAHRVGGEARIEDRDGPGATVSIDLQAAEPPTQPPCDDHGAVDEAGPRASVLVVDDDDAVRVPLADLLSEAGHRVTQAAGGADALAMLEQNAVDVLLCDFAMPGLNGVQVAARAQAKWPALKVVFMSGHAEADELRGALAADAVLLRKPFAPGLALNAIARVLADAI